MSVLLSDRAVAVVRTAAVAARAGRAGPAAGATGDLRTARVRGAAAGEWFGRWVRPGPAWLLPVRAERAWPATARPWWGGSAGAGAAWAGTGGPAPAATAAASRRAA